MRKIHFFVIFIIILAAAIAAAIFSRRQQYEVVHPTPGDIIEAVYGLGKVKSDKRYEVIVGIVSTLTKRYVNEGDFVKKGDPLVEFESRLLFRAPFDGTVTLAALYEGETALPHQPYLRIEDLGKRYIELSLEQQSALRVQRGQTARISFESLRGKVLEGKVAAIYPKEDEFIAKISVSGLDQSVLPGMTADVTVEIGHIRNALLIPLRALQDGMVSVKRNNRWQKLKVDVGHIDGLSAEVKGGLLSPADELRVRVGQ